MGHPSGDAHGGALLVLHERVARYEPHPHTASHTEHGLTYLHEGWLRMEHGGPVEARAGTFVVMPAGVPHRVLEGRDLSYWLVGFCATCFTLDESQLLMSPFSRVRRGAVPVLEVPKARRARVVRRFRDLREESARGAPESPQLVRAQLLLLLGEARRAMPGHAEAVTSSLVADALEVIQRRCLEPISLRDVAAEVCRTGAHVASCVKRETGYSVGEWINAGRVAEAAVRLAHTDEPLEVVAEHVGWRDKTHFIRQFRRAHGVTPAAWRRARREPSAG